MSKWPEWPVILNAGVIEKLQAERDAAYARGFAAGVEQAAKVADGRAEYWRDASGTGTNGLRREKFGNYEDAAVTLAAAIRALAAPKETR